MIVKLSYNKKKKVSEGYIQNIRLYCHEVINQTVEVLEHTRIGDSLLIKKYKFLSLFSYKNEKAKIKANLHYKDGTQRIEFYYGSKYLTTYIRYKDIGAFKRHLFSIKNPFGDINKELTEAMLKHILIIAKNLNKNEHSFHSKRTNRGDNSQTSKAAFDDEWITNIEYFFRTSTHK